MQVSKDKEDRANLLCDSSLRLPKGNILSRIRFANCRLFVAADITNDS